MGNNQLRLWGAALLWQLLSNLCCIGKGPIRLLLQSRNRKYRANTSLLDHVYKAATFCWQNLRHKDGYFSRLVVSRLLLAQIDVANRKPKPRFLLGLGEPFEPNPWDISDSKDDGKDFLMTSQIVKKELTQSKPLLSDRRGSPKSLAKLDLLRKDGISKST